MLVRKEGGEGEKESRDTSVCPGDGKVEGSVHGEDGGGTGSSRAQHGEEQEKFWSETDAGDLQM